MPVAWKILKAGEKPPWRPEWLALLRQFQGVAPARPARLDGQGFKRVGWQSQHTRMDDPAPAERLWLAIATGWLLAVGGEAEAAMQALAADGDIPPWLCLDRRGPVRPTTSAVRIWPSLPIPHNQPPMVVITGEL
ncbi:MAG: hypothetical protein ACKN9T_04950 [Candidatus Methylumidiphilus sp.]